MHNLKKGQVSIEYLIIAGFVVFLVISTLGVAMIYSNQIKDKIKFNQLENFANKVISSAEGVYYAGEPSQSTVQAYLPSGIQTAQVLSDQIVFYVTTSNGLTKISYASNVPLQGNLTTSEGIKIITIIAQTNSVILDSS